MEEKESVTRDNLRSESSPAIEIDTIFGAVIDHYKQDLREFFTRSNFYLAVQAALLSVFGLRDVPDSRFDYAVMAVIMVAGLALSVVWWVAARGGAIWIDRWRAEVQDLSKEYSPTKSYHRIEEIAKANPYQSPEHITKFLPLLFALVWLAFGFVLVYWGCLTVSALPNP